MKKSKSAVDEEAEYEKAPRRRQGWLTEGRKATMLPVKTEDGRVTLRDDSAVSQHEEAITLSNSQRKRLESFKKGAEKQLNKKRRNASAASPAATSKDQHLEILSRLKTETDIKREIANTAQIVMANPDKELKRLELLFTLVEVHRGSALELLALLSIAAVMKDCVPGYPISQRTDSLTGVTLSREVAKLQQFEAQLLKYYKLLLNLLTKKVRVIPRPVVAVVCDLLEASPYFNYSEDLISICVTYSMHDDPNVSSRCKQCLGGLLADDTSLQLSSTIIKSIVNKLKGNSSTAAVSGDLLDVVQKLQFTRIEDGSLRERSAVGGGDRKRVDSTVEKDMRQASVHPEMKELQKREGSILKDLFAIFLRILRAPHLHKPDAVAATLRGLGHLTKRVNIELLVEIVEELRRLVQPLIYLAHDKPVACEGRLDMPPARGWIPPLGVGLLAISVALKLTEDAQSTLTLDVSWTSSALCGIIRACIPYLTSSVSNSLLSTKETAIQQDTNRLEPNCFPNWQDLLSTMEQGEIVAEETQDDDAPLERLSDSDLENCLEGLVNCPAVIGSGAAGMHSLGNWSSLIDLVYEVVTIIPHVDDEVTLRILNQVHRMLARFPRLKSVIDPDGAVVSRSQQTLSLLHRFIN